MTNLFSGTTATKGSNYIARFIEGYNESKFEGIEPGKDGQGLVALFTTLRNDTKEPNEWSESIFLTKKANDQGETPVNADTLSDILCAIAASVPGTKKNYEQLKEEYSAIKILEMFSTEEGKAALSKKLIGASGKVSVSLLYTPQEYDKNDGTKGISNKRYRGWDHTVVMPIDYTGKKITESGTEDKPKSDVPKGW